jgi:hypothetical protein
MNEYDLALARATAELLHKSLTDLHAEPLGLEPGATRRDDQEPMGAGQPPPKAATTASRPSGEQARASRSGTSAHAPSGRSVRET